ncbi:MAG TPA: DNA mismatch repair endonuclease MutL [Myxococcota bacterium]
MGQSKEAAPAPGGRVQLLPDALIDQIAAGEVVERPASVVKELVENAIDAGASRIRVEVRDGGREFIAVADDGCGMSPADARLALQRHATSKIACVEDLQRVRSFGFRGEALPAIASVCQLRLRTRARGAAEGFELRVEAGQIRHAGAVGAPEGTRIEVADLFAAVPARRKFLKTASTEWGHIADGLVRCALALPGLHFDVQREGRPALAWPAVESPLDRVAAVLGEEDAAALVPVEYREGPARVTGFAARPDRHRPTLAGVYLYVNRRPVRDRTLQHALVEVYRDWLPRGRFPAAVLFVELPPEAVDVNVHPAKWEVRFADPPALHSLVRHGVAAAIESRRWLAPAPGATGASAAPPRPLATSPTRQAGDWLFAAPAAGDRSAGLVRDAAEPAAPMRFGDLRLLGSLLATYLLVEAKEGLLLVDQHAAHERVLFERLRAGWRQREIESQLLLVPLTLAAPPGQVARLAERAGAAAAFGFELEPFGEDTVVVRAVPALLAGRDPAALVRGLLDVWLEGDAPGGGAPSAEAADRLFASLACHAARRKGEVLSQAEQRALLDALDAIPWAPTCPHGRPVAVPFDLHEIERRFGRR